MSAKQPTLFEGARLDMRGSIEMTMESLAAYADTSDHWCLAWSGGKDSTCLLTLVLWLLLSKQVPAPKRLTVLYADTRMELLPLWLSARAIREELEEQRDALAALGCTLDVQTVMAPVEKRFLPYMLGRGVPPPNNGRLRWCTRQIKVDPMQHALAELRATTRGTEHTVARAREAGLLILNDGPLVCPAELGPGVRRADR